MFDIIPAHQDQTASRIDAGVVDDPKPRLASARTRATKPAGAKSPYCPRGCSDQSEYDQERQEEPHGKRQFRTEQSLKHQTHSPRRSSDASESQWLTPPETFAAVIPKKVLKTIADFVPEADRSSILMVNGELMANPPRNRH
jgi:hypothetical protein